MNSQNPSSYLRDFALEMEYSHLKEPNRQDPEIMQVILHDEFAEISSSGQLFRKADFKEPLDSSSCQIHDFQYKLLSETYLLTHYLLENLCDHYLSRRSSLWVKDQGRWKLRFHQGTPCGKNL